ncbi:hypothetical protein K443DRAFT_678952 [Laccaria amethystina LaAM-08-1]|uniref:DRBM domain-containing protein n=1 Tax=Laccaria amethystina LaAM-08-1 TaxID=1095629 RepID=A0A0C9XSM4_9AGAR|nr:hypothetical protein K443DRAFT_678952 [Laccaria amethystina LaAM-08-1]
MDDPINLLNNIHQRFYAGSVLRYDYDGPRGPQHDTIWQCNVFLDNQQIGMGGGVSKGYAKTGAARSAVFFLCGLYPIPW